MILFEFNKKSKFDRISYLTGRRVWGAAGGGLAGAAAGTALGALVGGPAGATTGAIGGYYGGALIGSGITGYTGAKKLGYGKIGRITAAAPLPGELTGLVTPKKQKVPKANIKKKK